MKTTHPQLQLEQVKSKAEKLVNELQTELKRNPAPISRPPRAPFISRVNLANNEEAKQTVVASMEHDGYKLLEGFLYAPPACKSTEKSEEGYESDCDGMSLAGLKAKDTLIEMVGALEDGFKKISLSKDAQWERTQLINGCGKSGNIKEIMDIKSLEMFLASFDVLKYVSAFPVNGETDYIYTFEVPEGYTATTDQLHFGDVMRMQHKSALRVGHSIHGGEFVPHLFAYGIEAQPTRLVSFHVNGTLGLLAWKPGLFSETLDPTNQFRYVTLVA